jgi:hypothetical protein
MPALPVFMMELYVSPVRELAGIIGEEFLKDFALGKANIHEEAFSKEIRDLFLPEEVFYTKKRYFR